MTNCPICLDVLSLPVTLGCSHTFCCTCLITWINESHFSCPICRTLITKLSVQDKTFLNSSVILFASSVKIFKTSPTKDELVTYLFDGIQYFENNGNIYLVSTYEQFINLNSLFPFMMQNYDWLNSLTLLL